MDLSPSLVQRTAHYREAIARAVCLMPLVQPPMTSALRRSASRFLACISNSRRVLCPSLRVCLSSEARAATAARAFAHASFCATLSAVRLRVCDGDKAAAVR